MAASTARPAVASKAASKPAVGSKSAVNIPNLAVDDLMDGYTPARLPEGTVTGVWGRAIIRPPGGDPRPLQIGDEVRKGDMILTSQNGIVQIRHEGTRLARFPEGESLENLLVAVNAGDAPPGAGTGSDGSLDPGLRVDRLFEVVSPQDYAFDPAQLSSGLVTTADLDSGAIGVASVEPGGPGSGDDAVPEGTTAPNTLVYTVTLTRAATTVITLPMQVGGGSASADDHGSPTFSNGVTRNGDGTLSVPPGVSSFTVSIPTVPDALVEGDETLPLTVGGVTGIGTITNDDSAPVAAPDRVAGREDEVLRIPVADLLANDSDADGDTPRIVEVRNPTNGSVTLVNGEVVFTPAPNYNGPGTFEYVVDDGHGNTTVGSVTVDLAPVNDAPVGENDIASVAEGGSVSTVGVGVLANDSDIDGDTLTVSAVRTGAESATGTAGSLGVALAGTYGHLTLAADGSYTYVADRASALAQDATATDTFTYTVSDGQGGTDTAELVITVTGTNDAPVTVGSLDNQASQDSATVSFPTVAAFSDPDSGDVLRFSAAGLPAGLSIDAATGLISGTLAADASVTDPYTIVVTATDPHGAAVSQSFVLTVTNPAPTAAADSGAVAEDASLTVGVAAGLVTNDVDPDGDTLRVSSVRTGAESATGTAGSLGVALAGTYGHLTLAADGSYTYVADRASALAQDATASDTFTYTVSDGQGGTDTAELVITVTGTNDAPVTVGSLDNQASQDSATVSFPTVAAFSDPDSGDVLRFSAAGLPAGLSIDAATGLISGTLAADASVTDPYTIVVTATDPHGAAVSQSFVLTVTNPAPTAAADSGAVAEDASLTVGVAAGLVTNDVDPDGDTLRVSSVRTGAESATGTAGSLGVALAGTYGHLTLAADGSYTYVADRASALAQDATATDTFTYTVSDGQGGTDTAELVITVTGTNDAPVTVGSLDNQASQDSATVSFPTVAAFSDPDSGDVLRFSAAGLPAGLSIDAATGLISGTLAADASVTDPYTIVVTATDPHGAAVSQSFVLTVTNPAPTAAADSGAVAEDASLTVGVAAGLVTNDVDPDGDTLRVSSVRTGAESATGTAGSLGVALAGTYGHLTLAADGSYTYVADRASALAQGATATDTFTYTVSDGQGGTDTAELVITVTGTNDAPVTVGSLDNQASQDSATVSFPTVAAFSDPDSGDVLRFSAAGLPAGLSIDAATGLISGTLAADASVTDPYTIVVTATDPHGAAVSQSFVLTVTNPAPTAAADSGAVAEDASLTVGVAAGLVTNDVDPDGDTLRVSSVRTGAESATGTAGSLGVALAGTYGHLTLAADGSYTYVADRASALAQGATATDTFTYTVSDGQGGTDTAELVITVTGTNDAPVTVGSLDNQASQDSATVSFPTVAAFSDPDSGDVLRFSAAGLPAGLSIDAATGLISGTLAADASVTDPYTIVVTATDPHGAAVSQSFVLTVTNPAPTAAADSGAVAEDASLTVGVAAGLVTNDVDPDGDTLRVSSVRTGAESATGTAGSLGVALAGTYGHLTLAADGSYTYVADRASALAQGATATDTFTYTVSDGQGGTDTAELVITVTGTNDAPVTVGSLDNQASQDSATVSFPTVAAFSDPDSGDVLRFSAAGLPAGLSIDAATGLISGTLAADASVTDPYTIVVTATDPHGAAVSQSFVLTVTNPAPTAAADSGAVAEDASLTVGVAAGLVTNDVDPDGDTLRVSSVRTGAESATGTAGSLGVALAGTYGHLTLAADGSYTYVADRASALAQGATATDTFTYTVSDGQGGTDTAELVITVTGTNDAPVNTLPASSAALVMNEDAEDNQGNATDPILFTAARNSALRVADPDTGEILTTRITVTQGVFTLAAASPAGVTVAGNGTAEVTLTGTAAAINAALEAASYRSHADFYGNARLTLTSTDRLGATDTDSVTLTVLPTVDARIDSAITNEGQPVVIAVLANDSFENPDRQIVAIDGQPVTVGTPITVTNGSVVVHADGRVTFTPSEGYSNTSTTPTRFHYTVRSNGLTEDPTEVSVQVVPVSDLGVTALRHWSFDSTNAGSVSDERSSNPVQTGSLQGGATVQAGGQIASALVLDGVDDHVRLDGSAEATTAILEGKGGLSASLSFWVKVAPGEGGTVIGSNSATPGDPGSNLHWGYIDSNGHVGLVRGSTGAGETNLVMGSTSVADGQWHHVVITYQQSPAPLTNFQSASIWIDGSLDGSGFTGGDSLDVNFTGFGIANARAAGDGSDSFFKGSLDEIRVYRGVLGQDEIAAIYSAERSQAANDDPGLLVLDNDQGSIAFAVAGTPTALHISGAPDGARLHYGDQELAFTAGAVSIAYPTTDQLADLRISGLGDQSAEIVVNATMAGGTLAKTTINVVAGHEPPTGSAWTITSGDGTDVFAWSLADAGMTAAPSQDVIQGFDASRSVAQGGDVLDLRDLLVGETQATLVNFLHLELPAGGSGSTTLHVSHQGGFAGGVFDASQVTQTIELAGTALATALEMPAGSGSQEVVAEMLRQQKLLVDNA